MFDKKVPVRTFERFIPPSRAYVENQIATNASYPAYLKDSHDTDRFKIARYLRSLADAVERGDEGLNGSIAVVQYDIPETQKDVELKVMSVQTAFIEIHTTPDYGIY